MRCTTLDEMSKRAAADAVAANSDLQHVIGKLKGNAEAALEAQLPCGGEHHVSVRPQ